MKLTYHTITDDEGREVCSWKYDGEYACYNQPPYEMLKKNGDMFCDPLRRSNYRAHYDGDVFLGFTNLQENENDVFLGIGLRPDLCGKGYGSAVIEDCCRISAELYPEKPISLVVRTWNKRAIRCYEKAGFVIVGEPFEINTYSGIGVFYRMVKK